MKSCHPHQTFALAPHPPDKIERLSQLRAHSGLGIYTRVSTNILFQSRWSSPRHHDNEGWIQERNNEKDRLEGYIIVWAKNQFWYNFEIAFVQA